MAQENAADESVLWRRHLKNNDKQARVALIEAHTDLVRKLAGAMYRNRYRDHVEFEEFFQLGMIGLIESVDRYDPDRGAQFETFAAYRIRGSILNGLEQLSELRSQGAYRQRVQRERMKSLAATKKKTTLFEEMVELTLGLAIGFIIEDSGLVSGSTEKSGDHAYKSKHFAQLRTLLIGAISQLPERESKIIRYHYLEGAQFEVIAEMLGVTKGRVSQLHKRALQLLRERLGEEHSLDTFL